jgi:hypothetical protein
MRKLSQTSTVYGEHKNRLIPNRAHSRTRTNSLQASGVRTSINLLFLASSQAFLWFAHIISNYLASYHKQILSCFLYQSLREPFSHPTFTSYDVFQVSAPPICFKLRMPPFHLLPSHPLFHHAYTCIKAE